jgi:hypothetical protein
LYQGLAREAVERPGGVLGLDTAGDPAAPAFRCSEQGKLPAASAFRLAERDKHMSEAKSFMQELDDWSDANVIGPLYKAAEDPDATDSEVFLKIGESVKKAIRQKVLESYRNGQQAGQTKPARKEPRR